MPLLLKMSDTGATLGAGWATTMRGAGTGGFIDRAGVHYAGSTGALVYGPDMRGSLFSACAAGVGLPLVPGLKRHAPP